MKDTINILYNNTPYIPNSYFTNKLYDKSDKIDINTINNNSTIFIINLDIFENDEFNKTLSSEYLLYNNIDYMIFNINKNSDVLYYLPSIKYFYQSEYNINNKYYDLKNNNMVKDLLKNIGYDIDKIETPFGLLNIKNEETVFYKEIEIYDSVKNENNTIIFMYFYTSKYDNYKSSIFYNNVNWNVFIYPYKKPLTELYYVNNSKLYNTITKINNFTIDFDNFEYEKFFNKIDYSYYQKNNINNLKNTTFFLKSLINNSNYFKNNNKNNNEENIFINLNEITEFENNNTSYLNNQLLLKRASNSISYSDINQVYSLTSDDKIANFNNNNDDNKNYSTFNFNPLIKYPLLKQYYINTSLSIENPDMLKINNELYKTLILIDPLIINPEYMYELYIYNIIRCNNILIIQNNNIELENIPEYTDTYYMCIYRIVLTINNINFYIILSIAFYNSNRIYTDQNISFNNNSYLLNNLTLIPSVFSFLNKASIIQNVQEFDLSDTKYYCYYLDFDYYSSNKSDFNKYAVNNFYFNISNIELIIEYNGKNISNINNVLELKVNNTIKNIINISNCYESIKKNIYDCPSTMVLTIITDKNISKDYIYDIIIDNNTYKVFKYNNNIEYNLINEDIIKNSSIFEIIEKYNFCLLIKIPDKFMIESEDSIILLAIYDESGELYKIDDNIFYIDLFNYKNANFGLYEGYYIVPRIIVSDYYNIYTINLYFDIFTILTEENTLLFNKDCFLKHLFDYEYSKELIIYDAERLVNDIVITPEIIKEFEKKNLKCIYNEYYQEYIIKINSNYHLFLINCFNIVILINKCQYLLNELKYIVDVDKKNIIIEIIIFNINYIIFLSEQNRLLYLTYSETITSINNLLCNLKLLNINTSKEELINLSSYCIPIENYFKKRIEITKNILRKDYYNVEIEKSIFYYEQYFTIYNKLLNNIYINIEFEKDERVEHIFNILFLRINNKYFIDMLKDLKEFRDLINSNTYTFNNLNFNLDDIIKNLKYYNIFIEEYENSLEEIIKHNIIRINNIEKITTFEEFIGRISQIYKNINFDYYKKFINKETLEEYEKNLLIDNKTNIIKICNINFMNIELNNNIEKLLYRNNLICENNNILVEQALNYIYVKTNYVFVDIVL